MSIKQSYYFKQMISRLCGFLLLLSLSTVAQAQWLGTSSSTGNIWRSGDVRIGANGSAFAGVKLQVEGGDFLFNTSTGSLDLRHFGTNEGWSFGTVNAGRDIQLISDPAVGSSQRRFTIRQNGDIGFNIFPTTNFDFYNATSSVNTLRLQGGRGGGVFTPSRIEFWSDPRGASNEWRPAFIQSVDAGGFTGGLAFFTNGSGSTQLTGAREAMRLTNGRVGLNVIDPDYQLHIRGTGTTGLQYDGGTGFAGAYMNGGLPFYGYKQQNAIRAYHYLDGNRNFRLWLNGTDRMVLDANGQLGIGINNPERPIHLRATNAIFRIDRDRNDPGFAIVRYDEGFSNVWKSFYFYTRGSGPNNGKFIIADWGQNVSGPSTARLVIANDGNVGIGDFLGPNPSQKLTVQGNALINGTFINSDKRFKKDIERIPNAFTRLEKLSGVQYGFQREKFEERNLPEGQSLGLIAQEVEKVFPELVVEDSEGYKAVNYDGLIPVLIEALKEQKQTFESKIEALEAKIAQIEKQPLESVEGNEELLQLPQLHQNQPNPFDETTKIKMYLPEEVQNATLYIYNMQGQTLKQVTISERGNTEIEIAGNTLSSGVYLYALIADNQEIDMKRMILR